ncbi:MAG: hypothetical protein ACD_8C00056G0019 [uncultured bacterium]|nr:MAG: hypothetical protein ACD_8C00056G0019 [uncultured bacterium]
METQKKNILIAVVGIILIITVIVFGWVFVQKKVVEKRQVSAPQKVEQPADVINTIGDDEIKAQLNELENLQKTQENVAPVTEEVISQQLKELEALQASQDVKVPTTEEIQAQLRELEALQKK